MKDLTLNSNLLKVPLYIAGKSPEEVRSELGLEDIVKLGSNENPLGTSPLALAALQDALTSTHRYPGLAEKELRHRLAGYYGDSLTEHHFLVGNGATDVMRMIAQGFISEGGVSVTCAVTFPLFALLTTMYGGQTIRIPPRADYHLDLPAIAEAITPQTRLVWLCSPNNPTGFVLSQQEIDEFLARVPEHVVVVFDESYFDFVTDGERPDTLQAVRQGAKVIVVRSFSKLAGLANMRVGYGIAQPGLVEYLLHTVMPFNTGGPAMRAAAASLDDESFRQRSRELVWRERAYLRERLSEMGLHCLPSQANFLLVVDPPRDVPALVDALLHHGIIVRPMAAFGLANAFRVTVGLREENDRFLGALQVVLDASVAA